MKGKIFNAQEVQAILNKSKVMFREVVKVQPANPRQQIITTISSTNKNDEGKSRWAELDDKKINILNKTEYFKCPYKVGEEIFCKEKWFCVGKWRPAKSMPIEYSRLTLQIKSIGVERLQDISREDCLSEGEDQWSFICNWNATHKKPQEKFEANPWVWCVNFEVVR